jgi:hypothetical protein
MEQLDQVERLAIDIPEAGRMAGMTPQRAYAAARSGYMPTVKVGAQRKVVPVAKWRAILSGEAAG